MEGPLVVVAAIIWCGVAFWIASDRGWIESFAPISEFLDRVCGDIWDGLKRAVMPQHRSAPTAFRGGGAVTPEPQDAIPEDYRPRA